MMARLADLLEIRASDVVDASGDLEGSVAQVILPLNGPDAVLLIELNDSGWVHLRELAALAAYVVQSEKDDSGSWPSMTANRTADFDLEVLFEAREDRLVRVTVTAPDDSDPNEDQQYVAQSLTVDVLAQWCNDMDEFIPPVD